MLARLATIPDLQCSQNVALSGYTRFAIGGPARVVADASTEEALAAAVAALRESGEPFTLIGGGSNLIVNDAGFPGVVLRYVANHIEVAGNTVRVDAGAVLQDLVDAAIAAGLKGTETMAGIPGWVGGAVYGNAGAYGHSMHEFVEAVRFFDGNCVREIGNASCEFRYRESIFKRNKDWIILAASLRLPPADAGELRAAADSILKIRNEKFPPTMRCAGSIFKNLLLSELPEQVRTQLPSRVIREGKVPCAYFLEEIGAKGVANGGIRVADYHANLIYSDGTGTSRELRDLISLLKQKVEARFGFQLEEEVQYVG